MILYELLTGTTPLEKQRFKTAAWDEELRLIKEEEATAKPLAVVGRWRVWRHSADWSP